MPECQENLTFRQDNPSFLMWMDAKIALKAGSEDPTLILGKVSLALVEFRQINHVAADKLTINIIDVEFGIERARHCW